MSDSRSGTDLLSALAHEFAQRYRRGERPALTEYTKKFPELAADIRELFPALVAMEEFGSVADPPAGPGPPAAAKGSPVPPRLGEYRILREVARGGMGIVYEAVQESLGRHVALKVLPLQRLLHAHQLERFRREARAAARLHHTHIVPVFGVGEQDGVHYYAMQFIQGQALDSVLEELQRLRSGGANGPQAGGLPEAPEKKSLSASLAEGLLGGHFAGGGRDGDRRERELEPEATTVGSRSELSGPSDPPYFRSVARVGVQVAEALAYAHQQGVLHRDIKPSNLLLDTLGTVWVTDFGLAKAEGTDELTHPGDIVGTLRYMAPERFNGQSDPRSDLYSLGLTLYELLTLQPAFSESDRVRLIRRITHEDPPRLRKLDPHIPRDLETILLKAIAREPAERYQSAAALAEDLGRFLADRSIRARRTPWHEQVWRWCRRNPVVAGLTAAVVTLLLVVAVGATVAAFRFASLAEAERAARAQTEQEKRQAEDGAERLIRSYRLLESGQRHLGRTRWREAHADLTEAADLRPDNPLVWVARGILYAAINLWDLAAEDFDRAFELHRSNEASVWNEHATLRLYAGDKEGYRRACTGVVDHFGSYTDPQTGWWIARTCVLAANDVEPQQVLALAEKAWAADPLRVPYLITLGAAHYRAGQYQKAIERLHEARRDDAGWTNSEAWPLLAMAYFRSGKASEARHWLDRTRQGLERQVSLVRPHLFLAKLPVTTNNFDRLSTYVLYREAQALMGGPPEGDHPLLGVQHCRGYILLGRLDLAAATLAQAVERHPRDAHLWLARGLFLGRLGQWEDAAAAFTRSFALRDWESPRDWCLHAGLRLRVGDTAGYRRVCAQMLQRFGNTTHPGTAPQLAAFCCLAPDAVPGSTAPLRLAELAVAADPKNAWSRLALGAACYRTGQAEQARQHLRQALAGPWPDGNLQPGGTVLTWLYLSLAHHRLGQAREARLWLNQAARSLDQGSPRQGAADLGGDWFVWLEGQILRREAETLLTSKGDAQGAGPGPTGPFRREP